MKKIFFALLFFFFTAPVFSFQIDPSRMAPPDCISDSECSTGEFCKKYSCESDNGYCQMKPDVCPEMYNPTCGCDGITYANECLQASYGISEDHTGECTSASECASDDQCEQGSFCQKDGCGAASGSCREIPQICTLQYDPVCGCDGRTYSNDCSRMGAGASRAYAGECPAGCSLNAECSSGQYCQKDSCESNSGICMNTPDVCPNNFDPVCGCDGNTYENECKMKLAGVNKIHAGACEEDTSGNNTGSFSDTVGHQFEKAIDFIREKKIVEGFPDGTFRPDTGIDRAQLTKIILLAAYGSVPDAQNCFPDVRNQWFAPYVCDAKQKGIINGYADGLFRPGNAVSYAEALKIILNAKQVVTQDAGDGEWFWPFVGYAFENELSLSKYRKPHHAVSRAEVAEIIYWLDKNGFPSGTTIACTEEAKICSDGSSVGRVPPNCEFAECPKENPISRSSILDRIEVAIRAKLKR